MKIPRQSYSRGFTMIEILLAIAIFSGVVLAIYKSWEAIVKSRAIGERAAVEAQRERMARIVVEQALSGLVMYGENSPFYSFETDTSGSFALMSFVARLPESFPGSRSFAGQQLRRVTFYVDQDRQRNNRLILAQGPVLQILDKDAEPHSIVLAKNISRFQLMFWDPDGQEFVDEWALTNQAPPLVVAQMGFGVDRRRGRATPQSYAEAKVAPPSKSIPSEYQIPNVGAGAAGRNLRPGRVNPANPNQPGVVPGGGNNVRQSGGGDPRFSRSAGGRFFDGSGLNFGTVGGRPGGAPGLPGAGAANDPFRYRRNNPYSRALLDRLRGNSDDEEQ